MEDVEMLLGEVIVEPPSKVCHAVSINHIFV
jgi:hypothetical protein